MSRSETSATDAINNTSNSGDIADSTESPAPRYDTDTLFRGNNRAEIRHAGVSYLLRITRNGKLILTK